MWRNRRCATSCGRPGNRASCRMVALDAADHEAVVAFCSDHAIGLVVIGPKHRVDGLADCCVWRGSTPSAPRARRRSSKAARASPRSASAPIFPPRVTNAAFRSTGGRARPSAFRQGRWTAGKGVVIAETYEEARARRDERDAGGGRAISGRGSELLRADRWLGDRPHRHRAGSQARGRGRHRAEHRHGRLFSRERGFAGTVSRSSSRRCAPWPPRVRPIRECSMPG